MESGEFGPAGPVCEAPGSEDGLATKWELPVAVVERPIELPAPTGGWAIIFVLAAVQLTGVLDFMIVMPLGPQFMRSFDISATEFGVMVASYTLAASIAGVFTALFVDRFDRKMALLVLYAGFTAGTGCCALAPTFLLLIAARFVTGTFGGIIGAMIFAIIGDTFPEHRRGMATGVVMASFAVASVVGVPFGLYLGTVWDWHAPFLMLVALGVLVLAGIAWTLPPVRGHLAHPRTVRPLREFWEILSHRNHVPAFGLIVSLMIAGFLVFPYMAVALQGNVGVAEAELPWIYVCGGAAVMFTSPLIGRLSDRFGKLPVYRVVALLSIVPLMIITTLGVTPLWLVLVAVTAVMICNSGRMVPAMAMVTASVVPQRRGGFMSVNASVQHFAAGVATFLGGLMIGEADGKLMNYGLVGGISAVVTLLSLVLAGRLRRADDDGAPNALDHYMEG